MHKIDLTKLSDAEYSIISDWELLGSWTVEKQGLEIEFYVQDLQIDAEGNIYKPTDFYYRDNSYADADTGYNRVEDIDFEWTAYDIMITRAEFKAKLLEYLKEDAELYLNIFSVRPENVTMQNFKTFLQDFTNYLK